MREEQSQKIEKKGQKIEKKGKLKINRVISRKSLQDLETISGIDSVLSEKNRAIHNKSKTENITKKIQNNRGQHEEIKRGSKFQAVKSKKHYHILLIESDDKIIDLLKSNSKYAVSVHIDQESIASLLAYFKFDLIVLDVQSSKIDTEKFVKDIKTSMPYRTPIICTDSIHDSEKKIKHLKLGCDDYLIKPIEMEEMNIKINNLVDLYTSKDRSMSELRIGDMLFDIKSKILSKDNKQIYLTPNELDLLVIFLKNKKILSRQELAKQMDINLRSVDVQVSRLRNKLTESNANSRVLQTVRNVGYMLYI